MPGAPCTAAALATIDVRLRSVLNHSEPWFGDEDIACNLPRIAEWLRVEQPAHMTELGVRHGVSSWTFAQYAAGRAAAGLPITYRAGDITKQARVAQVEAAMAGCPGVAYSFVEGDDLIIPTWETDFLFIDTWHTYKQLFSELVRWAPHTRRTMVLHDTWLKAFVDEIFEGHGGKPVDEALFAGAREGVGLQAAINDFLATPGGKRWTVAEENKNCNGITFLRAAK